MSKKYEIEVFEFNEQLGVGQEVRYSRHSFFLPALCAFLIARFKHDQAELIWN